jgi:hypothetical protein
MPECAAIQTVLRRQAMTPWQRFLIISSSSALALALFPAPSKIGGDPAILRRCGEGCFFGFEVVRGRKSGFRQPRIFVAK